MMAMPSGRRSSEPGTGAKRQRQRAEHRRHRRHENRSKAQQAGFEDRVARALAFVPLGRQREIHHHDRVLLTMPMSRMIPIIAITVSSVCVIISASSAPTPADGIVDRIVIG